MDLSVQKMQPPASLQNKSAAKKTNSSNLNDDAVETASRDEKTRFTHGNTGYEAVDADEKSGNTYEKPKRQKRRKQRQLLSGEDLTELTNTMVDQGNQTCSADGLMNLRAYQASPQPVLADDEETHFDRNI